MLTNITLADIDSKKAIANPLVAGSDTKLLPPVPQRNRLEAIEKKYNPNRNRLEVLEKKYGPDFYRPLPKIYMKPEEIFDKFLFSDVPISEWELPVQAEVVKDILYSMKTDKNSDAKLKNALYMSSLLNIPIDTALLMHDDIAEKLIGGQNHPALDVFRQIQKYEIRQKGIRQAVADGYSQSIDNMARSMMGLVKFVGESGAAKTCLLISPSQSKAYRIMFDKDELPYDIGKDWAKWADEIIEGLDEYRRDNPEKTMQIIGKQGFFNSVAQYINRPENILQSTIESVPAMIIAFIGHYTGLAAAKYIGYSGKVLSYTGRIIGFSSQTFGNTYIDARKHGTLPEYAFPQALLTAAGEGILEDMTLPGKLKLFHGTGKLAQKGIAGTAAQILWAFPRGAAEEGTQQLNANFWNMVFSEPDQKLMDDVLESAAGGGFVEMTMGAGFKIAGNIKTTIDKVFNKARGLNQFVEESVTDETAKNEITNEIAKAAVERALGVQIDDMAQIGLTPDEVLSLEPDEVATVVQEIVAPTETASLLSSSKAGAATAAPAFIPMGKQSWEMTIEEFGGDEKLSKRVKVAREKLKQAGAIEHFQVDPFHGKWQLTLTDKAAIDLGIYRDEAHAKSAPAMSSTDKTTKIEKWAAEYPVSKKKTVKTENIAEQQAFNIEQKKVNAAIREQENVLKNHPYYQQVLSEYQETMQSISLPSKIDFGQQTTEALEATESKPELRKLVAQKGQKGKPFDLLYEDFTRHEEVTGGAVSRDAIVFSDPHRFFTFIESLVMGSKKTNKLNNYILKEAMNDPSFYLEFVRYELIKNGESQETIDKTIQNLEKEMGQQNEYEQSQNIDKAVSGSVKADTEAEAEKEAIQSEGETKDIGDFLEGLVEEEKKSKHGGFADVSALRDTVETIKSDTIIVAKVTTDLLKNLLEKISFRLENINPKLLSAVRWHAMDKMRNTYKSLVLAKPFIKGIRSLKRKKRAVYDQLSYLLKSNDYNAIVKLADKYGLRKDIQDVWQVLKTIYDRAESAGINIEFRNDYFPRKVKDMQKLLKILYNTPGLDRNIIEDAIKNKAEKKNIKVEELTDDEIADTINVLFRGFKTGGVVIARPGGAKERQITDYTKEIDEAYYPAEDGLAIYIEEMESAIAQHEFFGRISQELKRIKTSESHYRDRVSALTKLLNVKHKEAAATSKLKDNYKKILDDIPKLEDKLFEAKEKLEEAKQKHADYNQKAEQRPSIGEITLEMLRNNEIKPGQVREIQNILRAYFNPGVQNMIVRSVMNMSYVAVLGNSIFHNLTQLGEIANPIIESLKNVIPATIRVLLRKEIVLHKDVPHKLFSEELNISGGAKQFINKILRLTLGVDDFGKAVHRNVAAMKAFDKAATDDPVFIDDLKLYFGDQWQKALRDIKTGEISENLLFYVFNRLSDRQPITGAEMPVYYHTSSNIIRPVFYIFKSFQINRLNSWIHMSRRHFKNRRYAKGVALLVISIAVWLTLDTATSVLKDIIRGKDIDEDDIGDEVIDNAFRMFLISKYSVDSLDYKKPSEVIMKNFTPPFVSIFDDVKKAYDDEDLTPLKKYVPLIGREIYETSR